MTKAEIAVKKFQDGYNCAQAVSYSFCNELNFDQDMILKLACGFGAGMGRKEEVCGAVSGGIMVLGMKYGRGENQDRASMEQTYQKARELINKFIERHGTFICRKLLDGCELTTPEGQKQFKDKDLFNKVCTPCVRSVVEIAEEMIEQRVQKPFY